MLDLPRAWGITTGSPNVIVASVDMGIRFDHPDIAANLTTDGYDFVSQIGYGTTESICDGASPSRRSTATATARMPIRPIRTISNSTARSVAGTHNTLGDHGLWTAGIIGAVGNDAAGMAGVAWTVKIRPIRVLGITGDGTNFDIAQGMLYAAGLPATGAGGRCRCRRRRVRRSST